MTAPATHERNVSRASLSHTKTGGERMPARFPFGLSNAIKQNKEAVRVKKAKEKQKRREYIAREDEKKWTRIQTMMASFMEVNDPNLVEATQLVTEFRVLQYWVSQLLVLAMLSSENNPKIDRPSLSFLNSESQRELVAIFKHCLKKDLYQEEKVFRKKYSGLLLAIFRAYVNFIDQGTTESPQPAEKVEQAINQAYQQLVQPQQPLVARR